MWYPAVDTETPAAEPISLPDAKKHVRAEYHTDDDAYLSTLISSARGYVEGYCGLYFAERDIELQCTDWHDLCRLPVAPIDPYSVSVVYVDADGATQTVPSTEYEVRGDGIVLGYGKRWPAIQLGSIITVTATAGSVTCPPAVKHAMRLWIASAYEVREDEPSGGRTAFDDLLTNFRR